MWRRIFVPLPFVLLACGEDGPPGITTKLALTAFDSCESLENYIQDQAVREMRARLTPQIQSGGVLRVMSSEDNASVSLPPAAAPSSFTRTNTQERGVDEPDFVKTDGTHIFAISGPELRILKSWPASELAELSTVRIEGVPRELVLEEEAHRVTVLSGVSISLAGGPRNLPFNDIAIAPRPDCFDYGCADTGATKITVLDVSNPASPSVSAEIYLPGNYRTARRVGSSLRLVLGDSVRWPTGVKWWPEDNDSGFLSDLFGNEGAYEDLMDANEELIRSTPLASWLPKASRKLVDGTTVELDYACTSFQSTNAPVHLGLTSVVTVDLAAPESVHETTMVTQPGEVYATLDHLYVATTHFWWSTEAGQISYTYLFKLRENAGSTELVAAGGVDGVLLDQFSMGEHQGYLRVATTIDANVEDGDFFRMETTNRVSVLGPELAVVGKTQDIAKGERIYSARFVGERGFVVTFRQIDPLFTIDLADPAHPKVIGELEVPGFSTYLHPLGDDHLLAIGVHFDSGFGRSVKLTIFDVSDFANPKEAFTQVVGSSSGSSEALDDHRAFTWFAEKGLLAIPFTDWAGNPQGFTSDVRVYHVDVNTGFEAKGALPMSDVYGALPEWSSWYAPYARRSILADDFVYAISDVAVRSASLENLAQPLATVVFE
ncbi:MAG: beta-propeller domain-containing protein [Deltaproteobacteria bacterium]|nr:beta-propeller domain-containing protein [Deltaproteobacteria bacterium]